MYQNHVFRTTSRERERCRLKLTPDKQRTRQKQRRATRTAHVVTTTKATGELHPRLQKLPTDQPKLAGSTWCRQHRRRTLSSKLRLENNEKQQCFARINHTNSSKHHWEVASCPQDRRSDRIYWWAHGGLLTNPRHTERTTANIPPPCQAQARKTRTAAMVKDLMNSTPLP